MQDGQRANSVCRESENQTTCVKERVLAWTSSQKSLSAKVNNTKMNMKKTSWKLLATGLCAVGLFTGMLSVAQATIAFTPPVLNAFGSEPNGNDGLFFTPTETISVTALGYAFPGTIAGNDVGLYAVSSDTLLASATVTSSDTLLNGFYYNSITPITLTAGVEYAVVGYYDDTTAIGYTADSGVGAAPGITFDGYKYDELGLGLDLPTIGYAPPIFGPNFQYEVSAVPEPTTMIAGALLLLPFGASTLRILRKNRVA
jgi:hypothetical protein